MAFHWRNDPAIRDQSHDPRALTLSEHQAWWNAAIASPDRHLLMAMRDGVPIGVLRLDQTGSIAEVSIYLNPAEAGRGLGREVLRAGLVYARSIGLAGLTASIKETNARSRSAFTAVGFERSDSGWICEV